MTIGCQSPKRKRGKAFSLAYASGSDQIITARSLTENQVSTHPLIRQRGVTFACQFIPRRGRNRRLFRPRGEDGSQHAIGGDGQILGVCDRLPRRELAIRTGAQHLGARFRQLGRIAGLRQTLGRFFGCDFAERHVQVRTQEILHGGGDLGGR